MADARENLQKSHETESRSIEETKKEEDEDVIERQRSIPSNPSSHSSRVSSAHPIRPGEKDCEFYVKHGWCGHGRKCSYNHPPELERSNTRICQFFLKGYCKHGSTCWYPHHMDGALVPADSELSNGPAQHLEEWLENLHLAENGPFENCGGVDHVQEDDSRVSSEFDDHLESNAKQQLNTAYDASQTTAQNQMQNLASLSNAMALRGSVTLPGTDIATGPALPQQLPMHHPYFQPTITHFANMAFAYQQTYAGNSSHHQNENLPIWHHGHGSRTMSGTPSNTYYNLQQFQQAARGYRQAQQQQYYGSHGYPNFYQSQTQQNPRDGAGSQVGQPSSQTQQLWHNSRG